MNSAFSKKSIKWITQKGKSNTLLGDNKLKIRMLLFVMATRYHTKSVNNSNLDVRSING